LRSLKLASENKINSRNMWSLQLIDHLADVVRSEHHWSGSPDFQHASIALQTGVHIYSTRVDNAHALAYQMLSCTLSRSAPDLHELPPEEKQEDCTNAECESHPKSRNSRKRKADGSDTGATLEHPNSHTLSSLENCSSVDPIFHKAATQLDEEGAHGLLLRSFPLHRGCEIAFDPDAVLAFGSSSYEDSNHGPWCATPVSSIASRPLPLNDVLCYIHNCHKKQEPARLTPALDGLYARAGMLRSRMSAPLDTEINSLSELLPSASSGHQNELQEEDDFLPCEEEDDTSAQPAASIPDSLLAPAEGTDCNPIDLPPACPLEEDEHPPAVQRTSGDGEMTRLIQPASFEDNIDNIPDAETSSARVDTPSTLQWLLNAEDSDSSRTASVGWRNPKYWRFPRKFDRAQQSRSRNATQAEEHESESKRGKALQRERQKQESELSIDFTNPPAVDDSHFEPVEREKDIKYKSRKRTDTLLPYDFGVTTRCFAHFAHLIAVPMVPEHLRFQKRKASMRGDDPTEEAPGANAPGAKWLEAGDEGESMPAPAPNPDDFDHDLQALLSHHNNEEREHQQHLTAENASFAEPVNGEHGDSDGMVEAPRKPEEIRVNYARRAKQIDVKELKETLERGILDNESDAGAVSFKKVISDSTISSAAYREEDLSVHMCFICLLHVANENQLALSSSKSLDELQVARK